MLNKQNKNGCIPMEKLKIECEKCSGLCCVALFCMKTEGFPANKEAGVACKHLKNDFSCDIHSSLVDKNMKGCLAYDCFGAGQKVTAKYGLDNTWKKNNDKAQEIFDVFLIVFQLHQMAWYLTQALHFTSVESLRTDLESLLLENEQITCQSPIAILQSDIDQYRSKVNRILSKVSEELSPLTKKKKYSKDCFGKKFKNKNLDGNDFSMALLIAADLEGSSLQGTNFLGADLRDANVKNTDLSNCIFLTQMQLNQTIGNSATKLPAGLTRPVSWKE